MKTISNSVILTPVVAVEVKIPRLMKTLLLNFTYGWRTILAGIGYLVTSKTAPMVGTTTLSLNQRPRVSVVRLSQDLGMGTSNSEERAAKVLDPSHIRHPGARLLMA
jgi:hypothetical protein